MRTLILCIATALFTLSIITSCNFNGDQKGHNGITFYICADGDDSYPGTSVDKAWKSIARVSAHGFSPGDQVLFKAKEEFEGTIKLGPEDSGTETEPLVISSYGEGRAVINGGIQRAIRADSCNYISVKNLELTGAGRTSGNTTDGLHATNCDGISIHEVEAHGFQKSGIHLHQCDDASITHVHAHENGFAGIHVTGATMRDPEKYDNHRLYIGYCVAENNPGDPTVLKNHSGNGILASSVSEGIIEYCEAFNNGWDMPWTGNGPVGIWIWDCTDFTIQYCIAHHNRTNPVAADGGGFDFDGGVSNSVIQYCIAHNNEGAGFGLYEFGAAKPWENNVVRYNISHNDGFINGGSVGIWKNDGQGVMRNCQIHNNTFYNNRGNGNSLWIHDHYPGFQFRNNVFIFREAMISGGKSPEGEIFNGNLYWSLTGSASHIDFDEAGLFKDPMLHAPGSLDLTDPEKISPETLKGFYPQNGSPLIDGGLDLKELLDLDPGLQDMVGTPIPVNGKYDLGAIESKDE